MKNTIFQGLVIGISIIIGCIILSVGVNKQQIIDEQINHNMLVPLEEAADILNISINELKLIIHSEKSELETRGSFTGEMFPYMTINDQIYVNLETVSIWIREVTKERREYINGMIIKKKSS